MREFLVGVFLAQSFLIFSQLNVPIGGWRAYLPHNRGLSITESQDHIIYGAEWDLVLINKEDFSVDYLSKVDGLSDVGIELVRHNVQAGLTVVIYSNSNIDILHQGQITNIPNILLNTSITGDRKIYDLVFWKGESMFLATGFGIVQFDLTNLTFRTTTFSGVRIQQIEIIGNQIYAGTEEGLYTVLIEPGVNLADFGQWHLLGQNQNLPSLYAVNSLARFKEDIYLGIESQLWKGQASEMSFEPIFSLPENGFDLSYLSEGKNFLIIGSADGAFKSTTYFLDDNGVISTESSSCTDVSLDAIEDDRGRIWYADEIVDFRYSDGPTGTCKKMSYDSPYSHLVSDLSIKDGDLLAASGGVSESFLYLFSREGFYIKTGATWNNFNEFQNNDLAQLDALSINEIIGHPSKNEIYAGSYWAGVVRLDLETMDFTLFNKTNSSLRGAIGDEARERITGFAFDDEENLWVTTYGAPRPLNVLTNEGEWRSFNVASPLTLSDISIDQNGYLWISIFGNNGGVLVYDPGESIQNLQDDRQRYFTSANSELTTNSINNVTIDLDGAVWVNTGEGPVIFDCGNQVFEDGCTGNRRKVLQDSIAAFLLADQDIRCMAVDGGDQKWFGTRNGIFVQSPDGVDMIQNYTTDNSPLFDNQIQALAYDGTSGLMYIATLKGLLSLRTESTFGADRHLKSEVYAFPNPVDPQYMGPIAIRGLVENAFVKITDLNGRLVYETQAIGGQAIWRGTNLNGEKISSGVYLVFSSEPSTFDAPDSFVTKIMYLR